MHTSNSHSYSERTPLRSPDRPLQVLPLAGHNESVSLGPQEQDVDARHFLHRRVSVETFTIAAICVVDLATTLYWVSHGQAKEGNPIMAFFLDQGHVPFIVAKIATFMPALTAAEWYRHQKPEFITRLLRWTIIGYLALYVAGVGAHTGGVGEFYLRLLFG